MYHFVHVHINYDKQLMKIATAKTINEITELFAAESKLKFLP